MVNQDLIHLKFEFEEARNSKMQLLSMEKEILNIAQTIKNYGETRLNELTLKEKLHSKTKAILNDLGKIHRMLPKAGIPKILEDKIEDIHKTKTQKHTKEKKKKYNPDIQSQLSEIQNKLNELSKR